MSDKYLQTVQWGIESTWGTPVAGAVKGMLITDFSLDPNVVLSAIKEIRGSVAPRFNTVATYVSGAGNAEGVCSYEDLPYWMEMLVGKVTPTGAGPYVRAWTAFPGVPAVSGGSAIRANTFHYGETGQVYRLSGALLNKLNIKGSKGEPWTFSADMIGKLVDNSGALAALSDRSQTIISGADTALYVDAWAGTIGTTAVPATAFSFELEVDTKRALKQHLGSLNADGYSVGAENWDAKLTLTMEFNATSKAFVDAMLVTAPATLFQRQVRIKGTSGTNIAQLDFAGVQDGAPKLWTDEDGVLSVEIVLNGQYNSTLTSWGAASITNGVATLL